MIGDAVEVQISQRIVAQTIPVEIQADRIQHAVAVTINIWRSAPHGRGAVVAQAVLHTWLDAGIRLRVPPRQQFGPGPSLSWPASCNRPTMRLMNLDVQFTGFTSAAFGGLVDGEFLVFAPDELDAKAMIDGLQATSLPENDVVMLGAFPHDVATLVTRLAGLIVQQKEQSARLIPAQRPGPPGTVRRVRGPRQRAGSPAGRFDGEEPLGDRVALGGVRSAIRHRTSGQPVLPGLPVR